VTVDPVKAKQSWGVLFLGLALFVGAASYAVISNYVKFRQIEPYTNVQILYQERKNEDLYVTISFDKTAGCHLVRYSVFGVVGPFALPLRYVDRDDLPDQYDRDPGRQTLRNIISLGIVDTGIRDRFGFSNWDRIEIRTRHICKNLQVNDPAEQNLVDRIFAVLDPNFVYIPPKPTPDDFIGIPAERKITH